MEPGLAEEVIGLERRLHQPNVRSSPQEVAKLLADSFVEIGSSGRLYTRSEIIDDLATEESRHIEAADFVATKFGPSVVKLTYRTSTEAGTALRESIWLRTDDGWKVVFHRGTRVH